MKTDMVDNIPIQSFPEDFIQTIQGIVINSDNKSSRIYFNTSKNLEGGVGSWIYEACP